MTKKLIIFDIDGTLVNSDKRVLASTYESITKLKEAGHELCIATGRNYGLSKEIIADVAFNHYICCNGSAAFKNHQLIYERPLPITELKRLVEIANQQEIDMIFQGLTDMRRQNKKIKPELIEAMTSFGSEAPSHQHNYFETEKVYQGLMFHQPNRDDLFADLAAFDFVRWHEMGVDVIPQGGSKAQTIPVLAAELGIEMSETIAFGDGNNDMEMLQTVGCGVAMGNATSGVKDVADYVTASCDEDGIYQALVDFKLI